MICIVSVKKKKKELYIYIHSIFERSWHLSSFNIVLEIKKYLEVCFKKKLLNFLTGRKCLIAVRIVNNMSNRDGHFRIKYHKIDKPAQNSRRFRPNSYTSLLG